ncbi:MAG TPA: hypothetical protein VL069_13235, partial [Opitutus sp.]|nr:hypothetical protein [Opitutus sp.]
MITIPRSVARQIAKVFRIALDLTPAQAAQQLVSIRSDDQGVTIFSQTTKFCVSYRLSGRNGSERCGIPLGLLKTVGGGQPDPVTLVRTTEQVIHAQWQDAGISRQSQGQEPAAENLGDPWSMPSDWVEQDGQLMRALADAMATTDPQSSRYALGCLQLRGARGEIAATDGRQALLQSGFKFGWQDDVLVPGSKLFGYGELPRFPSIRIGRTESHVVLEFGPWCYWLTIETVGRFPRVDDIIPPADTATTRVSLAPSDLQFLAGNLQRLPVPEGTHAPITVDLNGCITLRGNSVDSLQVTELLLSNSQRAGDDIRFVSDRRYLLRAAAMGLTELAIFSPNSPVLCHDARRKYVWALWAPEDAIKPASWSLQMPWPLAVRASAALLGRPARN